MVSWKSTIELRVQDHWRRSFRPRTGDLRKPKELEK
jgi:hypothetical protein